MNGATTSGHPPPVVYFAEALPGTAMLGLAAAVVWRGVPAPAALHGGGGPLGWLRGVRHRLWLRLGPLGADVSVAGRSLFGGAAGIARSVNSVDIPPRGEPLAYYDDGSRALRVLGRVLRAPPPGLTLVALVDAAGPRAAAPRLALRVVPTPPITVPRLSPPPSADAAVSSWHVAGEHAVWSAALRADPVVREFLDGAGTR